MSDLIQRVVDGIIRQEGRPVTDYNPGDIRDPVWLLGEPPTCPKSASGEYGCISRRKYFDGTPVAYRVQQAFGEAIWTPRSRQEGLAALYCQVAIHVREGDSLRQFIGGSPHYPGYAPSKDGNAVEVYVTNLCTWCGIPDADKPMWCYL